MLMLTKVRQCDDQSNVMTTPNDRTRLGWLRTGAAMGAGNSHNESLRGDRETAVGTRDPRYPLVTEVLQWAEMRCGLPASTTSGQHP